MKFVISLFFILSNCNLFAQIDSLKIEAFNIEAGIIEQDSVQAKETKILLLDSIDVEFSRYKNKIISKSTFNNSNTCLDITYYLNNGNYFLVLIKENSPISDDFWVIQKLYYQNDGLVHSTKSYYIPGRLHGIANSAFRKSEGSYNRTFTAQFLDNYIRVLFNFL